MSQENNFIPEQESYKKITPFRLFVKSNFPFIEATYEALDNYGLYCKVVEYLNEVIANENTVESNVQALYDAFVSLNTYVSDYFDNLDVQEEINNKLDDLVSDGTLENLIGRYVDAEITPQIETLNNNVSVLSNRMDTFTHLSEGSTTGDAELIDARVGFTGAIFSNTGDNIRKNDEDINTRIDKYNDWIYYKNWKPAYTNKSVALGNNQVNLTDSPSTCFSGYLYCPDYSTVNATVNSAYKTRFYFIDKNDGTYTYRNNSDAESGGDKTFTIQPHYNYMLFQVKKIEGGAISPTECINNLNITVESPTNVYLDLKCDFVKIGGISKYIKNLKIYTAEYTNLMISNVQNNYEGVTSFTVYSCNDDATQFESLKRFNISTLTGHLIDKFGSNSTIECDYDLTSIAEGTRFTGSGYQTKVKSDRILTPLSSKMMKLSNVEPQKIITLIDDDTNSNSAIAKVKTVCDNLGVKCTFGCVTDRLGTNQSADIETLQNYQKAGYHITTHSGNHTRWYRVDDDDNPKFNAQEIETDLVESIETLKNYGFIDCDMLVYPGTSDTRTDVDVPAIAKKWCKCGVKSSGGVVQGYGNGKYKISRTFITNEYDLSHYTNMLDLYDANDMPWCIFGTHSSQETFNETLLSNILQYALSHGWKIMTLNEAIKYREKFYTIQEIFGL